MSEQRSKRGILGAAVLLGCLCSPPVWAAEPMQPLQWTEIDGMSFISGGVSMRERRKLFELADKYDVLVSFAEHGTGQFLANVNVTFVHVGDHEPPVTMQSAGPYLIAQLPDGQYNLIASAPGWESSMNEFEVRPNARERVYVTLEKRAAEPPLEVSQR